MRLYRLSLLVVALMLSYTLTAQELQSKYRWGKKSFISGISSTFNGIKPLARWIWNAGEENPRNYYLLVRKTFKLDNIPTQANAFISAYAYADVYINGKLLERCPMNCDPEYQNYDQFSILNYLKKGDNCITAVVQNFGVGLHSQMNARGGFFFQANLSWPGKPSANILSDNSWKVIHARAWDTATRFREPNAHLIGFVEEFDARLWPDGWQEATFDDAAWEHATMIGVPPVTPWKNIIVTERPQLIRKVIKPVRQWKAGNVMVYDFGEEISGYPQFTIHALKEGVQFEIGTGERLDSLKVPLLRASGDHSEKYTTKKGVQSWRPYTWTGFRYFSIEIKPGIQINNVSAAFACYDYEMDGSFECSDQQLNSFWNIGKHTLRINSIDTYQDPWREHTQYIAGDSRYMQIYGNYAFGKSSRFLSAYNILCGAESQRWRTDGAVRSRYPTDYFTQAGSSTYLSDYQLEWVLMMKEYFMYYGKDELIENLYPNMVSAMDYYNSFIDAATGLLADLPGWIVLDWPDTYGMERKRIVTGLNCLYYGALNAAVTIAVDFKHDEQQAIKWKTQAAKLKESINKYLWSEKEQGYLDSYEGTKVDQQPQVYALVYGLADSSKKVAISKLIMEKGKASEQSFAYWMLTTMFAEGNDQWALDYIRKNWGDQTHSPSFTGAWQEGWNLDWGATSHAWSSGPTALLSQKILGLEPTSYGWQTFSVKPYMGDLFWAKGKVATVSGDITVAWQRTTGNHFSVQVNVPKETSANVYLPAKDGSVIRVNGKQVQEKDMQKKDRWIMLTVSQGAYQFECDVNE